MKSLKLQFESLLDDDDIFLDSGNEKKLVKEWINDNYKINGNLTISDDFVVNCAGHVTVKNKSITSLTNGLFSWGEVDGFFNCGRCDKLTSLEGAPKKVGGYFYCGYCDKLTSLEGAPKIVGSGFYCESCINLKSLKGVPKKIGGNFYCHHCEKLKITDSDRKKYKIVN